MISIQKVLLFALYSSALTAVVYGRETLGSGGGAGGGSSGRLDKPSVADTGSSASNTGGHTISTTTTTAASSTTVTSGASSSANSSTGASNGSTTIQIGTGNASFQTTASNVGSSSNIDRDQQLINNLNSSSSSSSSNNNGGSNNSNVTQNFGTTGSLAIRQMPVLCPICDAVPDKSYTESLEVSVGKERWTCGYLQETVQDTDQFSVWQDEAMMCRQSQILAEEGGCCAETMHINAPAETLNNPCSLCEWHHVPDNKMDKLVNTVVVGWHTCGGLQFAMKRGVFTSNLCPKIKTKIKEECCSYLPTMAETAAALAEAQKTNTTTTTTTTTTTQMSMLRGAALTP